MTTQVVVRDRNKYSKYSTQPRFSQTPQEFFLTTYNMTQKALANDPGYNPDSRKRDAWLRDFVREEPNLIGVLNTVVDIDKNRGWRMVGGRNQVLSFTDMFHNFQAAPGLYGWRSAIGVASSSFWRSDMGAVVELGRQSRNGPLASLYTTDPSHCALTGDPDYPLHYYAKGYQSKPIRWRSNDFIRVTGLPNDDDKYNGLGYCAVSRCIALAELMIAVYEHDREVLGSKAPRGLMFLNGINDRQWKQAMEAREAEMTGRDFDYFGNVAVLASSGGNIDGKMLALSSLPTSFNLREWMDMLIYGYALCFGIDPSEVWPVQFGALGRGTETEIQSEKASAKGRVEFVLGFQEQIQEFLPPSLEFIFDQRDDKGDLLKAEVNQAKVNVVRAMFDSKMILWEEARVLLADEGIIPTDWTEKTEQAATDQVEDEGNIETDLEEPEEPMEEGEEETPAPAEGAVNTNGRTARAIRDELLASPAVMRAATTFPNEPIVQYSWPDNMVIMLFESGSELMKRSLWNGVKLNY